MIETKYTRTLDPMGRLVIPSRLRDELGFQIGDLYTFYLYTDEETGRQYLCIECPHSEE